MLILHVVVVKVSILKKEYNMQNQIEITDAAANKVNELVLEEGNLNLKLRIFVQGGGCSGFSYGFTFDEDIQDDDLFFSKKIKNNEINFLIDPMSMNYLIGAKIDYKEDLMSSEFVITNPNALTTCGCGSSFSV